MNCATHSDTAAVAFCRTCGKPLCNNCTRDVRGVIYCEACLAARMEGTAPAAGFVPPAQTVYPPIGTPMAGVPPPINPGPNPTVAGILGAIPLGLGAVYCGQYAKGLVHLGIFVLAIVGEASDVPWYVHAGLGIFLGFFWVYQIVDAIRTAHAIQAGQPAPDPFGLSQTFGTGEKFEGTKVPIGAAVLIGLGVLFLLHTAGIFEIGMGLFISLILIFLGVWLFARQWGLAGGRTGLCYCERCRTRKLMGPAILVTIGVLLLLDTTTHIDFGKTWPAILLVIGVIKLMQGNASWSGHIGPLPPGTPPGVPPPPAVQSTEQAASSGEVKNV
jgi:Domain of unknown function (DUF5668)/B-box zinc finger